MNIFMLKNIIYWSKKLIDWFNSRWDTIRDNIHTKKLWCWIVRPLLAPTVQSTPLPLAIWLAQELACDSNWCNQSSSWSVGLSHQNEMLSSSLVLNLGLRYWPEISGLMSSPGQEWRVTESWWHYLRLWRDIYHSYPWTSQFYEQIFPFLLYTN